MVFKEVARLIGGKGGRAITGTCNCAQIGEGGRKEGRERQATCSLFTGIDG